MYTIIILERHMTIKLGRNEFKKTSRKKECRFPFRFRDKLYYDCIKPEEFGIFLQVTDIEYKDEGGNYVQGNVTSAESYICATGSELLADEIFDYSLIDPTLIKQPIEQPYFGRNANCETSNKVWYDEFKIPKVCYEQTKSWHSWFLH